MNNNFKAEEEKIKKEAEETVRLAYVSSQGYEPFIKLLPLRKNVGSKTAPHFVEIVMPYMTVAGRLKMMADEHLSSKARYEIKPAQFVHAPDAKTLLCKMEVDSLRGTATAHAKVGVGGGGVDASNPYENAETSALGRALGFLGYGVLGTGIASYEEMHASAGNNHSPTAESKQSGNSGNNGNGIDATLKMKIKQALMRRGASEIGAISRVNALQTRDEAMSFLIELGKASNETDDNQAPKSKPDESKPDMPEPKPDMPEPKKDAPNPPPPTTSVSASAPNERVKTKDLIAFKNLLVQKIGEQEARRVLPKIKTQADIEDARRSLGL